MYNKPIGKPAIKSIHSFLPVLPWQIFDYVDVLSSCIIILNKQATTLQYILCTWSIFSTCLMYLMCYNCLRIHDMHVSGYKNVIRVCSCCLGNFQRNCSLDSDFRPLDKSGMQITRKLNRSTLSTRKLTTMYCGTPSPQLSVQ